MEKKQTWFKALGPLYLLQIVMVSSIDADANADANVQDA